MNSSVNVGSLWHIGLREDFTRGSVGWASVVHLSFCFEET